MNRKDLKRAAMWAEILEDTTFDLDVPPDQVSQFVQEARPATLLKDGQMIHLALDAGYVSGHDGSSHAIAFIDKELAIELTVWLHARAQQELERLGVKS